MKIQASLRRRPLGVTLIAFLTGMQALALLLSALLIIIGVLSGSGFTAALTTLSIVSLGFAVFLLFFAYGLWQLRGWAFWTTIVLQTANALASVVALLALWQLSSLLGLLLSALILGYFLRSSRVRQAFGRRPSGVFVKQG
jgi:hypothetical protein